MIACHNWPDQEVIKSENAYSFRNVVSFRIVVFVFFWIFSFLHSCVAENCEFNDITYTAANVDCRARLANITVDKVQISMIKISFQVWLRTWLKYLKIQNITKSNFDHDYGQNPNFSWSKCSNWNSITIYITTTLLGAKSRVRAVMVTFWPLTLE